MTEESASASLHGRVVGRGEIIIEEGVFGEHREPEGVEAMLEEIDDNDLGGDEELS